MGNVSFSLIFCSPVFFFQVSTGGGMHWTCRFCAFVSLKRGQLLKHYRLKHGGFTRTSPIPCLHQQCICTFKSFNALKVHLSRFHSQMTSEKDDVQTFSCQVCEFNEPCSENDFFYTFAQASEIDAKSAVPLSGLWLWDKCILYF